MDEFVSRMETQRYVLNLVNSNFDGREELFGLSKNAIFRWAIANEISATSHLVQSLEKISSELFFMATRSQESISNEYNIRRDNILKAVSDLEDII